MFLGINGTWIGCIKPLFLPNPQHKIWSTPSPEAELQGNLQTLNFWICPTMLHGTPTYTFLNSLERAMELIRSEYVPIPGSSWQFFWNKYDILTTNSQWILVIAIMNFFYLQTIPNLPYSAPRSISGDDFEKFGNFDCGENTEYKQVMSSFWRIILVDWLIFYSFLLRLQLDDIVCN